MVQLTQLEYIQGISTLIFVLIAVILGLKVSSIYFKYKRREFYLAGLTLILLVSPYYFAVIDFLMIILTGIPAPVEIIYIGISLVAFTSLTWLTLITDLLYKQKQKIILGLIIIQIVAFEIFLIYAILVQPTLILIPFGGRYYREAPILIYYYIFSMLIFLITGFLFARGSVKSENKEVRLKGKFLFVALISYVIGAILDIAFEATAFTETLARLVQISSFTEFYIGFTLPDFIKKALIKND